MDGLAKHSITGILSVFGAALDYAVEPLHYIPANPMRYVKYPKAEKKPRERIILTLEEWQRIMARFPAGSRYHISLMIGFYTGLRISEAFALAWDDLQTYVHDTEVMAARSVDLFEPAAGQKLHRISKRADSKSLPPFNPLLTFRVVLQNYGSKSVADHPFSHLLKS